MSKKVPHEAYLSNPFRVDGIQERFVKKASLQLHSMDAVNRDTGEATPLYTPEKNIRVLHDPRTYAKVYAEGADVIRTFSDPERNLFLYILSVLKINQDTVYLNEADVLLWCGFARATFFRSRDALIEKRVLACKVGSYLEFFINPNIIYNGDRVKLFSRNRQSI